MKDNDHIASGKNKSIIIKNARVHNLKNLSVEIPHNQFIVVTGLSGSGKSSLAFDTIYAEGQRRYVESLSSYARQFLGRMPKPEVDYIKGISPAIAIEQKVKTHNPRSTVGTSTEIYDYLKLLFARIGKTISPVSGKEVKKNSVSDVVDFITRQEIGTNVYIQFPVNLPEEKNIAGHLANLQKQGYRRIRYNGSVYKIDEFLQSSEIDGGIQVVIDRLVAGEDKNNLSERASDSVQAAFFESGGFCNVITEFNGTLSEHSFSDKFELDGQSFEEPSVNLFSFNNPYGACKICEGYGSVIGIDEDLVVPNKNLSVYEEAIVCWKGEKMSEWKDALVKSAYKFDFPIHKPYNELNDAQRSVLWTGNKYFGGINDFFKFVEEQTYKIQYRVMLARYRGKTVCPDCKGTRLRQDAAYVKINGKSVVDILLMPLDKVYDFLKNILLNDFEKKVVSRVLPEILKRLEFLMDVGLSYLTLNRASNTLSGGESQRINLASALGSSLVGSTYILDEPSIGLHPRDTGKLIKVLEQLKKIGNTVIVVEHDEDIIKASDHILDIGPLAGSHGGNLVFEGNYSELTEKANTLTSKYLNHLTGIQVPDLRNPWKTFIEVKGAHEHNLKNINVKFPLHIFTVVTGVSGSGKTSLVKNILYAGLKKHLGGYSEKTGKFNGFSGDIDKISFVEYVDQNPIGKSSRSNPATYIKAYDEIRNLFCDQQLSKVRGFKPGYFSFNIPGGRCEECQGDGYVTIEMQFMADIYLKCESCEGKRFKEEVLDIFWRDKNITDVLDMTISEAIDFFGNDHKRNATSIRIADRLQPLEKVGLGYLRLGQACSTLSGGEAQRLKLASFLSKGSNEKPTMFIFDEPTTGLHFHDIHKLYEAFVALIDKGHTIVVIEHNLELIKCADWIIDLGPEGGNDGGNIVFEGTPEALTGCESSHTGRHLKSKLVLDKKL